MKEEFDYGNARHNVPASFLREHEPIENVAPCGRGYFYGITFHPLSRDDDALCDAGGVPTGFQWSTEHEWQEDREKLLHGQHVEILTPEWAARRLAARDGRCCAWDGKNFRLWATKNFERESEQNRTLDDWAERLKELADKQGE